MTTRARLLALSLCATAALATPPGQYRLLLKPEMLVAPNPGLDFRPLVDEQLDLGDPPSGTPKTGWKLTYKPKVELPQACVLDLGAELPLATLWLYDTNGSDGVVVSTGTPERWERVAEFQTDRYLSWRSVTLDRASRYLKLDVLGGGANFTEIALDAYSPAGWQAMQAKLAADAQREADRLAELARAKEEALKRPVLDLPPFGRLSLVDEVLPATDDPKHTLSQEPAGGSSVQTILGRACRVVTPRPGEGSYISYRLGQRKLLRANGTYVLVIDYPEDAPRSTTVINCGDESSRGFHTGLTTGDALHAKYVNSLVESLDVPLTGQWQQWTELFRLHDRFPDKSLPRGEKGRPFTPEDGFDVTICTMSAENDPLSRGPAIGRLALYEVVDVEKLAQPLHLPPKELPHRRVFWREEMADGVIGGKTPETRGVTRELDWYVHKADLMQFLGQNTYTKDLLEFGACQHWDPTAHGGNAWVHFDNRTKGLWGEIVKLMGSRGFEVLPYYEYCGSKGDKGLGYQRRCKPLGRDDAYTHIGWVENANADVTDPDTLADFCKMIDCTVLAFADRARFPGVWLRTRGGLPVGFGDSTRERFAKEANGGVAVSRGTLKTDKALYAKYLAWWHLKRRDFFVGVRDYLRAKGLPDAFVLYTGVTGEPGCDFGDWTGRLLTDKPDAWAELVKQPVHQYKEKPLALVTPAQVAETGLYRKALLAPGLNWGGWEINHYRPTDDPENYQQTDGLMLTHAFNREYTVVDPGTLDLYRTPAGLTLMRHYALNEHNMFGPGDTPRLDYFLVDMERAGPFCMLAEALAVANGDPTQLGYLTGGNFARGFPQYVRDFNANYLALPALPSQRVAGAASDPAVVVRTIDTGAHGVYVAVVNTGFKPVAGVKIKLPRGGTVKALATGQTLAGDGSVTLDLRPCQLVTLGLGTR